MDEVYRRAAVLHAAMDLSLHTKLRLGHRSDDHRHQHAAVSAEAEELAFDAKDAARGAGNQGNPGPLQEVFHAGPSQAGDEQGSDGGVQPRRDQSDGELPADGSAAADLVGSLPYAHGDYRTAASAVDWLGERSVAAGPILYIADLDGGFDVGGAENDADHDNRPGATTHDDDDADHLRGHVRRFSGFERLSVIYSDQ